MFELLSFAAPSPAPLIAWLCHLAHSVLSCSMFGLLSGSMYLSLLTRDIADSSTSRPADEATSDCSITLATSSAYGSTLSSTLCPSSGSTFLGEVAYESMKRIFCL